MKTNASPIWKKFLAGTALSAVVVAGLVSAANVDPIASPLPNVSTGDTIQSSHINDLSSSVNILDVRTNNFKDNITVNDAGEVGIGAAPVANHSLFIQGPHTTLRGVNSNQNEIVLVAGDGINRSKIFLSDPLNTQDFSVGAEEIGGEYQFDISYTGNSKFTIEQNGKVGIGGVQDPSAMLSVLSDAPGELGILVESTSADVYAAMDFYGNVTGGNRWRIQTPTEGTHLGKLQIIDEDTGVIPFEISSNGGTIGTKSLWINAESDSVGGVEGGQIIIQRDPTHGASDWSIDQYGGDGGSDPARLRIGPSGANSSISVLENGAVGIGTGTPSQDLSIGNGSDTDVRAQLLSGTDGVSVVTAQNDARTWTMGVQGWRADDTFTIWDETAGDHRLSIRGDNGYVGVFYLDAAERLHVNGNVRVEGTVTQTSDERLKENINNIESALEKINALRGVTYQWKDKELRDADIHFGFIAQEVEEVAPELVKTYDDEMQTKTVKYMETIALLTEAVQELSEQNDALTNLVCEDHPKAEVCQ